MSLLRTTRHTLCALLTAGLLLGCNDDDDKDDGDGNPVGPVEEENSDAAVFAEIGAAFEQAVGLLFVGGGAVPGAGGGQIVVAGSTFSFEDYSPDGEVVINGELVMNLLASPVTVKGTLDVVGSENDGDVLVDLVIDTSVTPLTYGGTVTIGGEEYDVAELTAEQG